MCGFLICGLKGEAGEGGGFSSTQGESSVDISKKKFLSNVFLSAANSHWVTLPTNLAQINANVVF